jgi:hypothetical protein
MEAGRLGVPEAEPFGVSWCGHTNSSHTKLTKPSQNRRMCAGTESAVSRGPEVLVIPFRPLYLANNNMQMKSLSGT